MTEKTLITIVSQLGLPTALVLYLLFSFEKKLDRLISLVDKLTGMLIMAHRNSGGIFDE